MRRRQLKWLWARLKQLSMMALSREELLMKLGAARAHAPAAWRFVVIAVAPEGVTFTYHLDRNRLRRARRREGRYLLRTNLTEHGPAELWNVYLLLVRVEEAFKNLKGDLASGRSSIKTRPGSKRISSSPSWPLVCTPLLAQEAEQHLHLRAVGAASAVEHPVRG